MMFKPADAGEYRTEVVDTVKLSARYFLLKIARPARMSQPEAGQFIQLAVPDSGRFFLRRPFSVFACGEDTVDLLIVEVGEGTRAIRRLRIGDSIDFYGPLGNGFPEAPGKKIVGIGGGVGLAPLYFFANLDTVKNSGGFRLLYGGRTREDLFLDHIPMERAGILLATDDGSYGFKGNAVELASQVLSREGADIIYSCGPTPMLKAVQQLAEQSGLPHLASLENRMSCGMGACRACVVPTTLDGDSPYRTVCHDGPVFDAADLVWPELPMP
jgi:dihydroorotate dehydrogenase electron transfer subunit